LRGECGETNTSVSGRKPVTDAAASRIARQLARAAPPLSPPTPGTRMGACAINTAHTTAAVSFSRVSAGFPATGLEKRLLVIKRAR
jgi:hypothetical protein